MLKNERGFTLIEMLIVLMIISVLILLFIPSLSGKSEEVNSTGCEALVALVQAQVDAYYLNEREYPATLAILVEGDYITTEQTTCSNNLSLGYSDGKVTAPSL
ncbi:MULTISPECIES: competence type IV pilus major pilin ComGC [Oceanobacillus]|uniref:ComG operon protein 3 n=1 Tax=Oceanobacillus jordanicus TaxID=2867266 RepID=A0AAW5B691_9BACI|nr:competence type IV pilus major pilin ComGC [Oceanobacillus jordanicus]MCG3418714.1 prepilin-type N-terminal cleavage/methylation domain-containing protein [Oceanobacillus jordanicus]